MKAAREAGRERVHRKRAEYTSHHVQAIACATSAAAIALRPLQLTVVHVA